MGKNTWGRDETVIWPQHIPVYTYSAVAAAIMVMGVLLLGWFRFANTPLQRFYTPIYARASTFGAFSRTHRSTYRVLFVGGHGLAPRPAMEDDVVAGQTLEPDGRTLPLALSVSAQQHGYALLFRGPVRSYVDARLSAYMRTFLFEGTGLLHRYKWPALVGVGIFLIMLPFAVMKDVKRQKQLKYGRRLKGPEMLTPREFNAVVKGDGIGFTTDGMRKMIRIPIAAEAQHIQIIGDTGAGKSALIFQLLRQIRGRGESAIVYDPAREYVKRFYDPARGDVILNPLDKRCPYWGASGRAAYSL